VYLNGSESKPKWWARNEKGKQKIILNKFEEKTVLTEGKRERESEGGRAAEGKESAWEKGRKEEVEENQVWFESRKYLN
jgi:hypothetical protein